ncbi:hypothetical protein L195_g060577, partial [Trifolium pratense]
MVNRGSNLVSLIPSYYCRARLFQLRTLCWGRMADLASELMRIAAEHKGDKSKKKARKSRPGVSNVLVAEQAASGSISQSSPVLSSAGTPAGRAKRQREEQM